MNYREYKENILRHFDEVLNQDLASLPNYRTMVMLRDKLVEKGLDLNMAENVMTKIQVVVSPEIYEDLDFILVCTDKFAEVVWRIYQYTTSTYASRQSFINMVDGMALTLVPPSREE